MYGGDFAKFCGLLRIYELYSKNKYYSVIPVCNVDKEEKLYRIGKAKKIKNCIH